MNDGLDLRDGLIRKRLESIGRVVMFTSGKGGVGKSTISAASAILLSRRGSVGVLDVDLHGPSIPLLFGVRNGTFRESVAGLVPSKIDSIPVMSIDLFAKGRGIPLRGIRKVDAMREMLAITDYGPLDTLIVDMPPGTGDEFLTALNMFRERGTVVFVTQPTSLSWNVTRRAVEIARQMKVDIAGVLQNMGSPSKSIGKDCARLHVKSLGGIGVHYSITDRPVTKLKGTAFMSELRHALELSGLL